MFFSSRQYAIGMAHYQIAGGYKSLFFLVLAYVAIAGSIIGLALYDSDPMFRPRILVAISTFFLVLEGIGLVVLGAVRVGSCIRTDITNNMIESHRQMPVAASRAMMGYLLGTTAQILAVVILNAAVLGVLEGSSGIRTETIFFSQIVLLGFAFFVWTFSAMSSFMFRQAMPMLLFFIAFGTIGSMALRGWGILPGISILAAPFLGETIFTLGGPGMGGVFSLATAYPVALTAQAIFATLFFIGACRQYRGTYVSTFNLAMGLVLVGTWGVLSAIGIHIWPNLIPIFMRGRTLPEPGEQIVAALLVACLLMLVPAYALAKWKTHRPLSWQSRTAALAAIALAGGLVLPVYPREPVLWIVTLLMLATHTVIAYGGFRLTIRATPLRAIILMLILIFVVWFLPLALEFTRWCFLPENRQFFQRRDFSLISSFSPLGVLLGAWNHASSAALIGTGAVIQISYAGLIWAWVARARRNERPS